MIVLFYIIYKSILVFIFKLGSVSYSTHNYGFGNQTNSSCNNNSIVANIAGRAVHERSPSVDLSMESSSVTSLSNLPLRKTTTSGKSEKSIYWKGKKNFFFG